VSEGGDPRAFILANTRLGAPPLVPELALHLADEAFPLWHESEAELAAVGVPPPYWAFAWAGGQALARYLLDHRGTVRDATALDLGAGSGLVGIAAALAGARTVLAAEIDRIALAAMALNAEANAVRLEQIGRDILDEPPPDIDLLLVGDLFYEHETAWRVEAYIERARGAGIEVLVGDPGRHYLPAERLEALAEYRVPVTRELEDQEIKRTAVYRLLG